MSHSTNPANHANFSTSASESQALIAQASTLSKYPSIGYTELNKQSLKASPKALLSGSAYKQSLRTYALKHSFSLNKMAYRYRYSARKTRRSGKPPFYITLIVIGILLYASIFWILPLFVNTVGLITSPFKTTAKSSPNVAEQAILAPPVLNVPFEATNTATMIIRGYATPGSTVKIYLNDQLVDEVRVSTDGSFNTSEATLTLGTNSIYGKSVDSQNNEGLPSKIIKITYDNEKPNLEVYEPENNKPVQGERKLRVSGKTDPEAEVLVNDSRVIVKADGTFQTEISLSDGDNTIVIKAADKASNTAQLERKVTFQP